MNPDNVKIESSWKKALKEEFRADYFQNIKKTLLQEKKDSVRVYPPGNLIFNAFNTTPLNKVKVVIIGQDPYHGPGEAMGLSFSVPKTVKVPPSLKNIYKELKTDLNIEIPTHGDLTSWAQQGVLLLNAMLTVKHKSPGSHKKIGWQTFTNAVIKKISDEKSGVVFLLWGRFAQGKKEFIDNQKHHVLEAAHPSPLAGGAYFGSKHFSKTNKLLEQQGLDKINWAIK